MNVEVIDHDPKWERIAAQTIEQIWPILSSTAVDIQHIGSTSIKKIKAKPIIDIAICVRSFSDLNDCVFLQLEKIGIHKSVKQPLPGIILGAIRKEREGDIPMNIHIVEKDSVQWISHINFRDYMINFPKKAEAYEKLKVNLAASFPNDIDAYTAGKKAFIEECINDAKALIKKK